MLQHERAVRLLAGMLVSKPRQVAADDKKVKGTFVDRGKRGHRARSSQDRGPSVGSRMLLTCCAPARSPHRVDTSQFSAEESAPSIPQIGTCSRGRADIERASDTRTHPAGRSRDDLDGKVRRYLEADGIVGTADWRLSLRLAPLREPYPIDNREAEYRIDPQPAGRPSATAVVAKAERLDRDTSSSERLRCLTIADLQIRRCSVVVAIDRSGSRDRDSAYRPPARTPAPWPERASAILEAARWWC